LGDISGKDKDILSTIFLDLGQFSSLLLSFIVGKEKLFNHFKPTWEDERKKMANAAGVKQLSEIVKGKRNKWQSGYGSL
jgi:hypothetical protein